MVRRRSAVLASVVVLAAAGLLLWVLLDEDPASARSATPADRTLSPPAQDGCRLSGTPWLSSPELSVIDRARDAVCALPAPAASGDLHLATTSASHTPAVTAGAIQDAGRPAAR